MSSDLRQPGPSRIGRRRTRAGRAGLGAHLAGHDLRRAQRPGRPGQLHRLLGPDRRRHRPGLRLLVGDPRALGRARSPPTSWPGSRAGARRSTSAGRCRCASPTPRAASWRRVGRRLTSGGSWLELLYGLLVLPLMGWVGYVFVVGSWAVGPALPGLPGVRLDRHRPGLRPDLGTAVPALGRAPPGGRCVRRDHRVLGRDRGRERPAGRRPGCCSPRAARRS